MPLRLLIRDDSIQLSDLERGFVALVPDTHVKSRLWIPCSFPFHYRSIREAHGRDALPLPPPTPIERTARTALLQSFIRHDPNGRLQAVG
jgi:hypothetical protein